MKFWQKTYLILSMVFILCLNAAILLIAQQAYQKQLESYENKASGEAYFIANAMKNDFSSLEKQGELTTANEDNIFQSYAEYYEGQGVTIALHKEGAWYYTNVPKEFLDMDMPESRTDSLAIWISTIDDEKYVVVKTMLGAPYSEYTLLYRYHLKDFVQTWDRMMVFFVLAASGVTVLLSIILYGVLKALTKPIRELSVASREIAGGNYKRRVLIKGSDELAELGGYFNEMAVKIERNIEVLQEETERKQRLVDNLAHELRTPLTAITGYAEYMQVASLDEEERYQSLKYIREEGKRIEKLSQVLLLLADIRESEIPMEQVPVEQLVESIKQRFQKNLREKEIVFKVSCNVSFLYGNSELLEILLSNLLDNAIRACDNLGIIEVKLWKEHEQIHLSVSDNGIGIKEEDLGHITEAFYRADKARSRKVGGVGLGATLCEQIAARHHAKMCYRSEPGCGTAVSVIFFVV